MWVILLLGAFIPFARAVDAPPYIGRCLNGRGETLKITAKTIQFANDRPVAYRDLTRATDGSALNCRAPHRVKVNAFRGKSLAVQGDGGTMQMTGYASHADYMHGGDIQMRATWERDGGDEA